MVELIFKLIGIACLTSVLVNAEPVEKLRERIFKKDNWFTKLITCALCLGFWLGFFFMGFNLLHAGIVSILAELISRKINYYE
jgi:hypothetical protein